MNKFEYLTKLPFMIGVPIGAASSSVLAKYIQDHKLINENTLIILIFIASFLLISKIIEELLKIMILDWIWIRKAILGEDFIEGWWYEFITKSHREDGNSELDKGDFTIISIFLVGGAYQIKGHLISSVGDGVLKGSFDSTFSTYNKSTLVYVFKGPWLSETRPMDNQGFARINFTTDLSKKPPKSFEGEVINIGPDFNRTFFLGQKVDYKIIRENQDHSIIQLGLAIHKLFK